MRSSSWIAPCHRSPATAPWTGATPFRSKHAVSAPPSTLDTCQAKPQAKEDRHGDIYLGPM